jgi:hypothetical protein
VARNPQFTQSRESAGVSVPQPGLRIATSARAGYEIFQLAFMAWSPLKFVLEEADEARLHGDNYKAEALINIAFDILDRQHNARRDRTAAGTVEE